MASCGCWFQKEEKTRLSVYFSFMIFLYPTTTHFSFTTDSEIVWAQETQNISAVLHIHTLLRKAYLQFRMELTGFLEDLLVQTFAGIWKVWMERKWSIMLGKKP